MTWARPELLLAIPLLWMVLFGSEWLIGGRRARLVTALGSSGAGPRVGPTVSALLAAAGLLGVALAGPAGHTMESEVGEGGDVVLAVDVSRSMTVADVAPRRAELARLAGQRLSAGLDGRVGLVAFADQAHLLLPPTRDRDLLELYLESLDPDVVTAQGSDLARTLHVSLDALESDGPRARPAAVVLITDGEGFQTPAALEDALGRARRSKIPVHALQVGTEAGGRVPGVVGARSVSRPDVLARVASETDGRWADVRDREAVDAVADALASASGVRPRADGALGGILVLLSAWILVGHAWWVRHAARRHA